jgi:hypothetical protein
MHSGPDQFEYNEDMEEGYNLLKSKIDALLQDADNPDKFSTALNFIREGSKISNELETVRTFLNSN